MTAVRGHERVRQPAVAGLFYPADGAKLRALVRQMLAQAFSNERRSDPAAPGCSHGAGGEGGCPKAVIAPHAGYVYSGPIAASAYALVAAGKGRIQRVVMIGPSHRVDFPGLAVSGAEAFATPAGRVPVDRRAVAGLLESGLAIELEEAHAQEHALEVQLPFLIEVLEGFSLVPMVFGRADAGRVHRAFDALWDEGRTLIVVSSDLSHYLDYAAAQQLDRATAGAIEALKPGDIGMDQACGRAAIQGLLETASARGWRAATLDLRNSGDTAGPRREVVGYGAFAFG